MQNLEDKSMMLEESSAFNERVERKVIIIIMVLRMVVWWKTIHVAKVNGKFKIFFLVMTLVTSGWLP